MVANVKVKHDSLHDTKILTPLNCPSLRACVQLLRANIIQYSRFIQMSKSDMIIYITRHL